MKILFCSIIFLALKTSANSWAMYGLGAKQMAMGNSSVAVPGDAFSQTYNPSLMIFQTEPLVSTGFSGAVTQFKPIDAVIIDTPDLGNSTNSFAVDNVRTKTPDAFGYNLALVTPFKKNEMAFRVGLHFTTPVDKTIGIETQDSFVPQYTQYIADSNRFTLGVNFAKRISSTFGLGFGADIYLVQAANTIVRLNNTNSTGKIKMDVKPGVAPIIGMIYQPWENWLFGFTYHGEQNQKMQLDINSVLSIVGTTPLEIENRASLFYDPRRYDLGVTFKDSVTTVALSARYEKWSDFNGTDLRLAFRSFSFVQRIPVRSFQDTVGVRLGYELRFPGSTFQVLRIGYAFIPTPYPDQSGENNMLDSDKNSLSVGTGVVIPEAWLETKAHVDIVGFGQVLKTKEIKKTDANFVGAPGYTIGGQIFGYGVTFTAEF